MGAPGPVSGAQGQIRDVTAITKMRFLTAHCVAEDAVSCELVSAPNSLLYRLYATTRNSSGEMIRKLSVIRSRKRSHFLVTVRLRKRRIADLNCAKVS